MSESIENKFVIKVYTKKDLRLMYGVPYHTFRRWLSEIPETSVVTRKNYLTAIQVEAIVKVYGIPKEERLEKIKF